MSAPVLVCISGCCWCGTRYGVVEARRPGDEDFLPLDTRLRAVLDTEYYARPCGHRVRGEMYKRSDGIVVVTLFPLWGSVPHMHALQLLEDRGPDPKRSSP